MQLMRSAVVGTIGSFVNVVVLTLLVELLGVYYLFAALLAYLSNLFICFTGDRLWTYQTGASRIGHRFARYVFAYSLALAFKLWLLYAFVEYAGLFYVLGQIAAIAVGGLLSFFAYKYWVFR